MSSPAPRKLAILGLVFGSLLTAMVLSEAGLRDILGLDLAPVEDEKSLTYRHDPELGWLPMANSNKRVMATRRITADHRGHARVAARIDEFLQK